MDRFLKTLLIVGLATGLSATPAIAGNAANGSKVFTNQCAACHGNRANSPQAVGPRLFGIVGRHAGTSSGFTYSPAMKGAGLTWSQDELKIYLANPGKVVHGTKMPYAGLHNAGQLDDLIAYLASLR
ncbi:MAG: c-type cytochrome [Sphingomonadales bacterium]|nr:c-type cytochrome [Sphingomonadales bacterium]